MQTFKDKLLNEAKAEVLLQTQTRLGFGAMVQMEPSLLLACLDTCTSREAILNLFEADEFDK